ncbi:rab-GTPase-TBC domain-containing protein [Pilobolus umbonatus]|nr:rab-GTPase-TBC domain-containing protein [Pilobolus umbonatus]
MGRTRASSFNHQSIRRQQSDLVLPIRRPSYDSHARTQHKPSTTYLSVQTNITHQTGASSVEDSGSEDENSLYQSLLNQYGFIKSSQWITEDDFNQFESNYAPTVKRRLLKWRHLIVENGNRLPPRSSKVKRYIRKGIPAEYRGQAWLYYSGADRMMEANKGLYVDLVQKAEEMGADNENMDIIERDLHRTFPENDRFRPDSSCPAPEDKIRVPIIKSLRRLLLAFSLYAPSIGYCQSLNYIAGMLLLFMNEEEAFWVFVKTITKILPPNVYDVTMEGANIDQNVLMILIYERFPHIWNKISGGKSFWECEEDGTGMPTCSLVTSHWFLTLFINILPVESVLRVWDCLF